MTSTTDIIICCLYIFGIVGIGLLSGRRRRKHGMSADAYFLAGKSLRWPVIGLALFSTNISTIHLVSLAQSGFDTGLLNGNFEWMAAFTLILLAIVFVPFYIKSGVTTLPVFLEKRYNSACRDWLTVVSIVSSIVVHIGFSLLAGGIVIETLFGINMFAGIAAMLILVGVYTIVGGLRAVVITESVQTVVLLIGAVVLTAAAWIKVGGWTEIQSFLHTTGNANKLSMLQTSADGNGMPWYAVFLGYPVLGIWYWCADQTIVQRVLGARDENHARAGALFCGFLKILPVFIFVLPGLVAFVLVEQGLFNVDSLRVSPDESSAIDSKGIYTLMITQLLPTGLTGVVLAGLISALMSTVSGALNSISTLVSYDLGKRLMPQMDDRRLIRLGRISAVIALVLSILLLPLLNRYESLFNGLNDIIAHLAPPITCVFLLGIFWKGASAKAAQYTLWIGSLLGFLVYGVNKVFTIPGMSDIPFMMMAFYLFSICVVLQVLLSFVFPARHEATENELVWESPFQPLRRPGWGGIGNYKILSSILIATMVVLYYVFR